MFIYAIPDKVGLSAMNPINDLKGGLDLLLGHFLIRKLPKLVFFPPDPGLVYKFYDYSNNYSKILGFSLCFIEQPLFICMI